jgi:type IV pilus assembly protein PilA
MKSIQKGFTLIELMIVVAIIAILAAIAISQYQDYVIRSQVSEGSALADGVKTAVAEFVNNTGRFPASNISAGLSSAASISGQYVSQVDVGTLKGTVQATMSGAKANTAITGKILIFSAITHAGSIEWHCKSAASNLKQKWCSSSCSCLG